MLILLTCMIICSVVASRAGRAGARRHPHRRSVATNLKSPGRRWWGGNDDDYFKNPMIAIVRSAIDALSDHFTRTDDVSWILRSKLELGELDESKALMLMKVLLSSRCAKYTYSLDDLERELQGGSNNHYYYDPWSPFNTAIYEMLDYVHYLNKLEFDHNKAKLEETIRKIESGEWGREQMHLIMNSVFESTCGGEEYKECNCNCGLLQSISYPYENVPY